MVNSAVPLLRAGGQCRKIVLTLGSRCRYNQCCLTKGHCSNLKGINYGRWMDEKQAEVSERHCSRLCSIADIKRATVIELGQLIILTAGRSEYLHEEESGGKTLCT
jgi:hypothetical protein